MQILIIFLNVAILAMLAYLLLKPKVEIKKEDIQEAVLSTSEAQKRDLREAVESRSKAELEFIALGQKEQREILKDIQQAQHEKDIQNIRFLNEQMEKMVGFQTAESERAKQFQAVQLETMAKSNAEQQNRLMKMLQDGLERIQHSNESKLEQIQGVVNEKLDKTLNDRLNSNFKQISDQLSELYRSLGELSKLSSGVTDLNKTLSNVKTRGTWGEMQLQAILEQTLISSQYDMNVATKKNSSDRVEFAIKIPAKDDISTFLYLPIDSKMPSDIYNRIVDASIASDKTALTSACKELEQRIKTEARTIRDKYIDPPQTTDFAIMFLPTEGLYAEVLRINGLAEWCQTNCKVIISGPTTISALLNSLRVGFSNLALTKKSQEVLKLLQAVKTQYQTFNELIEKAQKKLQDASTSVDNLKTRTDMIQRKMSKVEQLDIGDSNNLLGLGDETEY